MTRDPREDVLDELARRRLVLVAHAGVVGDKSEDAVAVHGSDRPSVALLPLQAASHLLQRNPQLDAPEAGPKRGFEQLETLDGRFMFAVGHGDLNQERTGAKDT
ncbi:hypothetical protein D3C72_1953160 [compost metagenome]